VGKNNKNTIGKESLLNRWKSREKEEPNTVTKINKVPEGIDVPLSNGQKRLWFLQQLYPNNPFYNYSEIYTFKGRIDIENLFKSIQYIYDEQDILRSTYHIKNGAPIQQIESISKIKIDTVDYSKLATRELQVKLEQLFEEQANTHFNLSTDPLIKFLFIKVNDLQYKMQVTLHHIITDEWSMEVFREKLAKNYNTLSASLPIDSEEIEIQYIDYAYDQQQKNIEEKQLDYWKQKLSGGLPVLNLPTDFSRPITPSFKGKLNTEILPKQLSEDVIKLSKQLEVTPYVLLLSVCYTLLYRYSGQEDILIGSPFSNRDTKNLEKLIGFFNDTVVMRVGITSDMSFADLVKIVRKTTLEAFSNKNVPFDLLVKSLQPNRSLSTNPFFQVMFLYNSVSEISSFGVNLEFEHQVYAANASKFDLTLFVNEKNGVLSTAFEYATELFTESTINRFQEYFKLLLEGILENPKTALSNISMLSKQEKALLTEGPSEANGEFIEYQAIHTIIEEISKENPENKAVTYKDTSITYKELDERANRLASTILKQADNKSKIIGLCTERSIDMIVGLYGILKAGYAYLPIDPEYPKQRIEYVCEDANITTVITQKALIENFNSDTIDTIFIEDVQSFQNNSTVSLPNVSRDDLAYVIYTSGSTGKPKGVPVSHGNIIHSTQGRPEFYENQPEAFLLLSSMAFDSSKAGIFWTLCTGGNLVISEKRIEQDIEKIASVIQKDHITHTLMLPSLYKLILEHTDVRKLKSLTTVIVAGEACTPLLCKKHFETLPEALLYNEYGPTEATVWCIAHKIEETDLKYNTIPIGKAVANANIYLLDTNKKSVPYGSIGEIYVGGPCLAGNYLNKKEISESAFVVNPLNNNEKILYKTGDLGRYREDGNIEFFGRADQQVKIRGYRVELSEIENIISSDNTVNNAVVAIEEADEIENLDIYEVPDAAELSKLLTAYLSEEEIEDVLNSITSLKEEEKIYLLEQL